MSESKWLWLFLILEYLRACRITFTAVGVRHSSFGIQHTTEYSAYNWICLFVVFFSLSFLNWIHVSLAISFLFFFFRSLFVAKGRSSHFRNEQRMSWINSQFTLYNNVSSNSLFFLSSAIHFYFQFASSLLFVLHLFTFYNWLENGNENEQKTEHTHTRKLIVWTRCGR